MQCHPHKKITTETSWECNPPKLIQEETEKNVTQDFHP